jgi:hypothetical protein
LRIFLNIGFISSGAAILSDENWDHGIIVLEVSVLHQFLASQDARKLIIQIYTSIMPEVCQGSNGKAARQPP